MHETIQTLGAARDAYINRATFKSPHTIAAYDRAITLFFDFLADKSTSLQLSIQQQSHSAPEIIPLSAFSAQDAPIFLHFAQWMLLTDPESGRPYAVSTIELRLAGVQRWFHFLDDYNWLPPDFPLGKAKRILRDEFGHRTRETMAPEPPEYIEEMIFYYETQQLPPRLQTENVREATIHQWEVTRLRNAALLRCLAESGGRISEVLALNVEDFPPRHLDQGDVVRIRVQGKGNHTYDLRFLDALPAIKRYIAARGADYRTSGGQTPLFVSHHAPYQGKRITRITGWRVVQKAAQDLGIGRISPHDFRHWRATQLINAGHPLDVVQDYLGHRSIETTRAFYARTDAQRVDEAALTTRLPKPGQ